MWRGRLLHKGSSSVLPDLSQRGCSAAWHLGHGRLCAGFTCNSELTCLNFLPEYHGHVLAGLSGCKGCSLWFRFPDPRGASIAWAQVQYFSTAGSSKDGPPTESGQNGTKPSDEVLTAQSPKELTGSKPLNLPNAESIQVKVLKKQEYGTKYTQNNFITAVRAMNEFCLKPSDLEQLRKIRRRSPHDDTEAFTVFLCGGQGSGSLGQYGGPCSRERNLRKEVERQFQGNIFRYQQLLKEYEDFRGNTKEIQQLKTPEELEVCMLKHGENIIDTLGVEVDHLEKDSSLPLEWFVLDHHFPLFTDIISADNVSSHI